jgi:hypothetical protein
MKKVQRFRAALGLAVATGAVGVTAVALAQGGDPATLSYALGSGAPQGAVSTAQPGATTFTFSTSGKGERDWILLHLKDGADVASVQEEINHSLSPDQVEALVAKDFSIVSSGAATKGHSDTATVDLEAGSYLVADITNDKKTPSTQLTVSGDPTGAVAPKATTTVTMHDYKFTLSRSLPRSGVVRFVNAGKRTHMAIALKTTDAKAQKKLVAALKKGDERAAGRLIRGQGTSLGLASPGESSRFKASYGKGRYVFACFWGSKQSKGKEHIRLGMVKAFQVK